jgi:hypothetical protein
VGLENVDCRERWAFVPEVIDWSLTPSLTPSHLLSAEALIYFTFYYGDEVLRVTRARERLEK